MQLLIVLISLYGLIHISGIIPGVHNLRTILRTLHLFTEVADITAEDPSTVMKGPLVVHRALMVF
jgi:hypothetical protein